MANVREGQRSEVKVAKSKMDMRSCQQFSVTTAQENQSVDKNEYIDLSQLQRDLLLLIMKETSQRVKNGRERQRSHKPTITVHAHQEPNVPVNTEYKESNEICDRVADDIYTLTRAERLEIGVGTEPPKLLTGQKCMRSRMQ
jgi:hypothetical protein